MKKTRLLGAVYLCINLAFLAANSNASVIYDESIDGDIETYEDPPVFSLLAGTNTAIGSTLSSTTPGATDLDIFGFVVPVGNQLTSIIFEYEIMSIFGDVRRIGVRYEIALTGEDGSRDTISATEDVVYIYDDGSNPNTVTTPPPVTLNLLDIIDSRAEGPPTLPLSSGLYWFNEGRNMSGTEDFGPWGGAWDYTLTFEVEPIPIPPALYLFGSGLLGLIGIARRRKAS